MRLRGGEVVHDVAYRAYLQVMQHRGKTPAETPPPPSDIRLAFPAVDLTASPRMQAA